MAQVLLHLEQGCQEFAGSWRTGEFQNDRAVCGLNGNAESQEAAAVSLRFHCASDRRKDFTRRGEPEANSVGQWLLGLGLP